MSNPKEPDKVKLISSLFSPKKEIIENVILQFSKVFGPVDWTSPELLFDRTRYYAEEMGWPLYRRFISFSKLISADHLSEIKLNTNRVEQQYLSDEKRTVNIDPGYISAERLVLATGKNYSHRIYLSKGIFADLTLLFQRGHFETLKWTYPDYADQKVIAFFYEIRKKYIKQLKELRQFDKKYDCI